MDASRSEKTAQMEALLHDCAASGPDETADRLREAYALIAGIEGVALPPQDFAGLLLCGGYESAAVALLSPRTPYLLSRAGAACMATVVTPDGSEVWGEGATPALALLCAHLASLCGGAGQQPATVQSRAAAFSRLN